MAKSYVSVGDLAAALGVSPKVVRHGADVGRFPGSQRGDNAGGWRRWPAVAAVAVVQAAGRPVPADWLPVAAASAAA